MKWYDKMNEAMGKRVLKAMLKPFPCVHVAGLPVAEGASCGITMLKDRFAIEAAGSKFELPKAKVVSVERMTRTEIEKAMKLNAGLAALGGIGFGVVGAIVGASVGKEKELKRKEQFAVFTYESDGLKSLVFAYDPSDDMAREVGQRLRDFIKDFEAGEGYGRAVTIEL